MCFAGQTWGEMKTSEETLHKSENRLCHTKAMLTASGLPKHCWSGRCFQHMLCPTKVCTTQTHLRAIVERVNPPESGSWYYFFCMPITALFHLLMNDCAFVCWAGAGGCSHDHSRGSEVHDSYVWQSSGSPGLRCFGLCLIHQWFICHHVVRRVRLVLAVCIRRVLTWWSVLPCVMA